MQGSLGVECPFTLWNTVFLLAWQLLQNKFKVVLQMMPGRLSRSHLNCLFVMYKNLPNLQPAIAAWQSLIYCVDIVSWVIIFLKTFFFFFFLLFSSHLENLPTHCVDFPRLPWDPLGLPSLPLMKNAARVVFAISFLTPGSLHWAMVDVTVHSAPHATFPHGIGGTDWNLGSSRNTEIAPSSLRNESRCWHRKSLLDAKLPHKPVPMFAVLE